MFTLVVCDDTNLPGFPLVLFPDTRSFPLAGESLYLESGNRSSVVHKISSSNEIADKLIIKADLAVLWCIYMKSFLLRLLLSFASPFKITQSRSIETKAIHLRRRCLLFTFCGTSTGVDNLNSLVVS